MKYSNRAGAFTLIELMIVIAILGIVVAAALPGFENIGAKCCPPKKTCAKQDCDTLACAVLKYNSLEAAPAEDLYMSELAGRYVKNIEDLKDPWGNRYEHDHISGKVYSKGPDGLHAPGAEKSSPYNMDDIEVYYKTVKN